MLDRTVIERVLRAGIQAPSGDNSQPWSFSIDGNVIIVRCHPELDHPILNVDDRGTYIATGALIENMVIAARDEGLAASVHLFERDGETARIVLSYEGDKGHELRNAIDARHTHRGPYDTVIKKEVLRSVDVEPFEHTRLALITEPERIRAIADAAVAMEETALHTQKLHYLFFKSILWDSHHNEAGESGLYIKTTELPPPVQLLFRAIRHWPIMRVLRTVGLPKVAASQNARIYASSGAVAAIFVDRTEREDFVAAGRTMQRVWLAAVRAGLAAQPLAGLIYLAEYVDRTDDDDIDPSLKVGIRKARERMRKATGEGRSTLAMLLRIGVPLRPATARTRRKVPNIL